jgi:hypothetical protein
MASKEQKSKDKAPEAEKTQVAQPGPKSPEAVLLDPEWLRGRSTEELIEAILRLVLELKERVVGETVKVAADEEPPSFVDTDVKQYISLPAESAKAQAEKDATTWRIKLLSSKPEHKPLGLEICDEVVVGRVVGDIKPDLDLTEYDAGEAGVSRRHARLRPTEESLFLTDLDSTNGTFCNRAKLKKGEFRRLRDDDTISFGRLHFKVKIVRQPEKPAGPSK